MTGTTLGRTRTARTHLDPSITGDEYRSLRAWRALPTGLRAHILASAVHRAVDAREAEQLATSVLDLRDEAPGWLDGEWRCESTADGMSITVAAPRERLGLVAPDDLPFAIVARTVAVALVTGAAVHLDVEGVRDPDERAFWPRLSATLPPGALLCGPLRVRQDASRPVPVLAIDTRAGRPQDPQASARLTALRESYLDLITLTVPRRVHRDRSTP
jgi:hypothetical protein